MKRRHAFTSDPVRAPGRLVLCAVLLGLASSARGAPARGAPAPHTAAPPSRPPGRAAASDAGKPTFTAAAQREARTLFHKGLRAFAMQLYPDALAHFTASYRLVPKNVVLYNVAMCHRALFEYTKAILAFQEYITRRGLRIPVLKRQEVERFIREMEGKRGGLKLQVDPDGAEVRVDGQVVGRTPLSETLPLDPGRRVVLITHPERVPVTLHVSVAGGQHLSQSVRLRPAPQDGLLVLRCSVPRCEVQVDGGTRLALPVTLSLPVGSRQLRVEAPGHFAQLLTVSVTAGVTVTRQVALVASGVAPAGGGPVVRPVPLVRRWWLWTIVSAGVAALVGTTTGLVLWDQSRARSQADLTWRLP